eukprot:6518673-Heterocapsa_arctica.AAC.1
MKKAGRRNAFTPPEMMGVVSGLPSHSWWWYGPSACPDAACTQCPCPRHHPQSYRRTWYHRGYRWHPGRGRASCARRPCSRA